MQVLVVIPARYSSKRFPGKPLALLAGKTILERVWEIASFVCKNVPSCSAVVATETPSDSCRSDRIVDFCKNRGINVLTTSSACRSGSDRAWEVASRQNPAPDIIVNLQGDVPTCPPDFVVKLINALRNHPSADVASIYTPLSWEALDLLRASKQNAPFSGTTVVTNSHDEALWFSKNIIPAIRNENQLRASSSFSPIKRHVGLYAYRFDALRFFATSEKSRYEELEQLEQLRFIENGRRILMVEGTYPSGYEKTTSGVDSPEDLKRIELIIRENGELLNFYR